MVVREDQEIRIRSNDLVWRDVDEEIVILEVATGNHLTLNSSGRFLWLELATGSTLNQLSQQLQQRYAIEEPQASKDATKFVEHLAGLNLLVPAN